MPFNRPSIFLAADGMAVAAAGVMSWKTFGMGEETCQCFCLSAWMGCQRRAASEGLGMQLSARISQICKDAKMRRCEDAKIRR